MSERARICAIVGAGEGLGTALAAKFAGEGYDLALLSRSEKSCRSAHNAALTARASTRIQVRQADATDPVTIEQGLAAVSREMGAVEILIYNVRGSFESYEPLDMTYDAMEQVFRQEVVGAFAAAKAVLPAMRKQNGGTIFFSSATAAFRGSAKHPLYAIGKFGLRALSQSLAKAYSADGVHIVHVRLDCDLDVPIMRTLYGETYNPAKLANPDDVAASYWLTHQQPKGAWSNEIEIRPHTETWTY